MKSTSSKTPRTPRQLKVGEELRHALSAVFMRGDYRIHELDGTSITVSEVRISPDLSNATAYVMPLAGKNGPYVVEMLNKYNGQFRKLISSRVKLRHAPVIHFKLDHSFDEASKIETLLKKPEVARDLD